MTLIAGIMQMHAAQRVNKNLFRLCYEAEVEFLG